MVPDSNTVMSRCGRLLSGPGDKQHCPLKLNSKAEEQPVRQQIKRFILSRKVIFILPRDPWCQELTCKGSREHSVKEVAHTMAWEENGINMRETPCII